MNNLPAIFIKQKYYYENKKMRIELNKLRIRKIELDKKISDQLKTLEENNSKYLRKCKDLENEVTLLNAKLKDYNFTNNIFQGGGEKEYKNDNIDPECKRLHKDIIKLTHPDVAENEDLIPFFVEAQEAYERGDLLELKRIKDQIDSGKLIHQKIADCNEEDLRKELEVLINEFKKEKTNYNNILTSVQYRIYNLLESEDEVDNLVGEKIFLDLMLSQIMQLNGQLNNLKSQAQKKGVK